MEILKNLSESELNELRRSFLQNLDHGLNEEQFQAVLLKASAGKRLAFPITTPYLVYLFACIDYPGSGYVTWDDFSLFLIEQERASHVQMLLPPDTSPTGTNSSLSSPLMDPSIQQEEIKQRRRRRRKKLHAMAHPSEESSVGASSSGEDNEEDDGFTVFREYNLERAVPTAFETQVSFLYYAYRWNKLIKIVNDAKGLSTITIHHPNKVELPLYASLPRQPETALTVEYIPPTVGVRHAHSIACAYNGGIIRLFTAEKRHSIDEFLNLTKTINVPETQTVLKWAPSFCRLTMGSRGGIVSVWNVDEDQLYAQEKLHNGPITSIQLHRGMMYTASMDPNNSVKVVDLERSVVRFSFHDHTVGGALDMVVDEECLYSIGFEGKVVQRFLQYPKSQPSFLYDPVQPHEGRLCCMRRVPNTPLLLTSDSRGTLKIWDLRMGSCVQTMKFTSSTAAARANANRQQVNPFSTFIAHKSNKLPTNKNSNFVSPVVTESSPVNTACPLLNTGLILIGTSRELVTLSSAETTFPDLADDERSCRFIMMPNPHRFITIHEREAKLWQAETGHLIYSVEDLTQADVSSCSLVEPLRRQFVVGSMDGELRSFSVALGRGTFDFSPALEEAGFGGLELLSLHSLPRFRDYAAPYLIMTYPTGVCFLPMVEGVPATAVMRLHALTPLLDDKPCVTGSRLERDHLFVSTSTPAIHVFDLHHLGVPIATYQLTTNAENMCCAPLLSRLARSKVRLVSTPPPEEVYPASCALGEAAVSESPPEEDPAHGDDPRHLPDLLLQKRSPPLTTAFSTPKMATATATAITTTPRSMAQTVVFSVVLAADSSGSIVVGHALTNPMRENTMATLERAYHLVGDFNAGNSATWRWYHRRKHLRSLAKVPGQAAIPTTTFLNTSQRHIGGGPPNNTTATAGGGGVAANAGTATSPSALPAVLKQTPSSGSVARAARSKLANNNNNSSTPPLPALTPSATPAVTHVCYFDSFDVLATGDEHGQIRLWDMNGVVEVCRSTTEHVDPRQPTAAKHRGGQAGRGKTAKPSTIVEGGYAPVLITDWLSHPKGLTAMFGILHPSSHLPIIITAGVENTVLLWSADGVELGSLATGRLADDATGGRRFGLRPYALFESSFEHLHASWGVFMSYMSSHMSKDGEMELKTMQPVEESASALLRVTSPDLGRSAEEALARSHSNISPSALVPSFFVTETQAAAKNSVSNLDCRSTGLFGDSLSMMGSSICSEFEMEEEDTRSNEKLGIIKSIYQGKLNPTRRRPKPHLSRLHPTGTHPQQLPAIQHTAGEELGQDEQTEEDDLSQQRAEKFVSRAKEIREDRKRGKHRKALVKGGGIDNSANKWLGVGNTRGPPLITNGTNARVLTKQKKMTPRVVLPSLFPSAST